MTATRQSTGEYPIVGGCNYFPPTTGASTFHTLHCPSRFHLNDFERAYAKDHTLTKVSVVRHPFICMLLLHSVKGALLSHALSGHAQLGAPPNLRRENLQLKTFFDEPILI